MPYCPISESSPKRKSPLRTAFTSLQSISETSSSSSDPKSATFVLFSLLNSDKSDDGDEVDLHFSDQEFTFPTWWLYLRRRDESLPSADGVFYKNPAEICVHSVKGTGAGICATVDITWNTGTTSRYPGLWLRVLGPTKAWEQGRYCPRLPAPGGKNPWSGVVQRTLDEKRVADRYRAMLVETMMEYMDKGWLLDVPTSLLREMVEYVDVESQRSNSVAAQGLAVEVFQNDGKAGSSDEDSLIDEAVVQGR